MEAVARYVKEVAFTSGSQTYKADFIRDFAEGDNRITLTSQVTLDGVQRGWVGDMAWELDGRLINDGSYIPIRGGAKDVLLASVRTNLLGYGDSAAEFTYEFLKD